MDTKINTKISTKIKALIPLGANLNLIPFKSDALLYLDGTISGTQLLDKSGSNRHFTITGKDFSTTWTKGIPYKSAATISAPVGDATLIAADVNNYLYAANGTPNQIPVVSLFQDVDYEHKLFCRHAAQVLNANGVETYEPRVLDIVLYNTVKSSTDLITCQTFYSVPTENPTAYWVAKTGNDTTGNGSKSNPWLTVSKATGSATPANSHVYVKSGNYTRSTSIYYLTGKKVTGIGNVILSNNNVAGAYWLFMGDGSIIENLVIDSNNISEYDFIDAGNTTLNRCLLRGHTQSICFSNANAGLTLNMSDCVMNMNYATYAISNTVTRTTNINNCYVAGTMSGFANVRAATTLNFDNNRVISTQTDALFYKNNLGSINIIGKGNNIAMTGGSLVACSNAVSPGNTTITYSTLNISGTSKNLLTQNGGSGTDTFANNILTHSTSNSYMIYTIDRSLVFNRNVVSANKCVLFQNASVDVTCEINNNILNLVSTSVGAYIGNGGNTAYISASCTNNRIVANAYTAGQHGMQFYDCKSVIAKYNYIENVALGLILKSNGTITHETNVFAYNVLYDSQFIARSVTAAKFYNNTVVQDAIDIGFIGMSKNLVHGNVDLVFRNNIYKSAGNEAALISAASEDTFDSDYNIWNCLYAVKMTSTNYTLAQIQATNKELNSLNTDPQLINFIPAHGSVAINAGDALDAAYDDGLDATTDWGSATTVPAIVTKQHGASWEIGAYIS